MHSAQAQHLHHQLTVHSQSPFANLLNRKLFIAGNSSRNRTTHDQTPHTHPFYPPHRAQKDRPKHLSKLPTPRTSTNYAETHFVHLPKGSRLPLPLPRENECKYEASARPPQPSLYRCSRAALPLLARLPRTLGLIPGLLPATPERWDAAHYTAGADRRASFVILLHTI